jgi:ubiquinone/menaquinone biosynthesis C-methylase UbiE
LQPERGAAVDEANRQKLFRKTFDTVASGYDHPTIRFFVESVPFLIDALDLAGDESILDAATGTGNAALALAGHVPHGQVHGIDFSKGMLARAEEKKAELGLENVRFSEMDMQAIDFPEGFFDLAVCCFGLFFVENMIGQLRHMAEKVAPGGRVAVTSFGEEFFSPQADLFLERMAQYGVARPPATWKRTDHRKKCRSLFEAAGLVDVAVFEKDLGYYLPSTDQWWDVCWNAGYRGLIEQLPEDRKTVFRSEHLEEVGALADASGLWLNIKVIYTIGTRP